MKKIIVLLALLFVVGTSSALIPLAGGLFYISGGTFTMVDAFALSAVLHGAALFYNWVSSDTDLSGSAPAPSPTNTVNVKLVDSAPRENPDNQNWNNAPTGSVDPTPKPSSPVNSLGAPSGGGVEINGDTLKITPAHSQQEKQNTYTQVKYGLPGVYHPLPYIEHTFTYPQLPETPEVTINGKVISQANGSAQNRTSYSVDMKTKYVWQTATLVLNPVVVYKNATVGPDTYQTLLSMVCVGNWAAPNFLPRQVGGREESCNVYSYWQRPSTLQGYVYPTDLTIESTLSDNSAVNGDVITFTYTAKMGSILPTHTEPVDASGMIKEIPYKNVVRIEKSGGQTYLHSVTATQLCGNGEHFDLNANHCVDGDVKKPSTTPCEIVYHNGGWQTDPANPNCDSTKSNYAVSGNVVQVKDGNQKFQIERLSSGEKVVTVQDAASGKWRTVNLEPSGDGYKIKSVTDSSTGSMYTLDNFGTGASGSNIYTSNSGANCGAAGQSPCSIDDSGFNGKASGVNDKFNALGQAEDKFASDLAGKGDALKGDNRGFTSEWFPKLWPDPVACENMQLNIGLPFAGHDFATASATVDFCEKAGTVKDYLSWLFYIGGVFYLWHRLTRPDKGT